MDDHPGGRRLAMRAGDRDAAAKRGDLRQQVGAVQLAPGARGALGVVGRDGRGVDDLGALGDVGRVMADPGLDPVFAQPLGVARLGAVRAGHPRAERGGDDCQRAHSSASDADEMKPAC
jgi:hypothetical protein